MDFNETIEKHFKETLESLTERIKQFNEMQLNNSELLTTEELGERIKLSAKTILTHAQGYEGYPVIMLGPKDYRFRFTDVVEWYAENQSILTTRAKIEQYLKNGDKISIAGLVPNALPNPKKEKPKVMVGQQKKRGRKIRELPPASIAS